jgi:POT family proton-dependent oligopeptide transporter
VHSAPLTRSEKLAKANPAQHPAAMNKPEDRGFFGHPRGLGYIAFTEAWERFSYYGMQSLLILYMVNQLLHPGHIEQIAGFASFRHFLETLYRGPLAVQPLASAIFGLYTGLVYLTPILGGLLADRVLGRTRTIVIGALLMAAGQFLIAFDVTFLVALTSLLIGVGCFKGNLASQVGALYATGDNRRADAFQIYYILINAGVIISPLIAGTLGEIYGWQYGFGAAGIGMLIGLGIYLSGRKWLPPDSPVVEKSERAAKKTASHAPRKNGDHRAANSSAGADGRNHRQPANLQRLSDLGRTQRGSDFLRQENANHLAGHARLNCICKLSGTHSDFLAAVVEEISGTT